MPVQAATDRYPGAAKSYLIEVDGRARWARLEDSALPPASLTKLMTALVLLQPGWDGDAIVTIGAIAAGTGGARAGLREKERFRAGDLFTAMIVRSANDACTALVIHRSGSVEPFVALMNAKAREMGLRSTQFANPCGFDAPGHRSTARELLRIAKAAQSHVEVAQAAQLVSFDLHSLAGRRIPLATTNLLLGRVDGVVGLKSGYTSKAGRCLIVQARRGKHEAWLVLLDAGDRWWSSATLVEEAFHGLDTR